jgi:hypothetical protein
MEKLSTKLGEDVRVLRQEELDNVYGGFINDQGCTNWPVDPWTGIVIVPDGLNGWLIPGSPQRPN